MNKEKVFDIDEFLTEIGDTPLLGVEDEKALLKVIQEKGTEGDEMDRLVRHNLRYVVSVANQYRDRGLSLEELIKAGTEGLRMAAEKFDLGGESQFMPYAVGWIRQQIIQKTEGSQKADARIDLLLKSLERNHRRWNETFKDDDTGEEVTVERDELLSTDTTEEERSLMESIASDAAQISTEHLLAFVGGTSVFWPRPMDEVYRELVRRGDESWACLIEDPVLLQELCNKGVKKAAEQLYQKYRYGDEKNGIFIDKQVARTYYDLAGDAVNEPYSAEDDLDKEAPQTFYYRLTGNAATLDGVETLVGDLRQRFGMPAGEGGLFVPQQTLMRMLVGSDSERYRGNILTLERKAPDSLAITTEADRGEPLLYALLQAFPNLYVALKEEE